MFKKAPTSLFSPFSLVAEISDCGHFPMNSNSPEMLQAIADFIGKRS